MCKWKDLNRDGKIDASEEMFAEEMLCTSREEHIALFGNSGRFGDEEVEDDFLFSGLDRNELKRMDSSERRKVLEEEGIDVDDCDFD